MYGLYICMTKGLKYARYVNDAWILYKWEKNSKYVVYVLLYICGNWFHNHLSKLFEKTGSIINKEKSGKPKTIILLQAQEMPKVDR